jgi:Neurotransmitter-gated ion-channel transmembrane region.
MIKSGEWEINGVGIQRRNVMYPCCPNPFSTIEYKIELNRMFLYYFLYIIMPLVSQIMIFFAIFHIPYEYGDRMSFGVTILLGITVYLLVISEKLPEKSDNKPMLGLCFIAEFYILITSLIFATIIIKLATKTTPPPSFLLHLCAQREQCRGNQASAEDLLQMVPMHGSSGYLHSESEGQPIELPPKKRFARTAEQNKEQWIKICQSLDIICFYIFGSAALLTPLIIGASLDKTMLGI